MPASKDDRAPEEVTFLPCRNVAFGLFSSSRNESHQNRLRLLFCVEDTSEFGLGGFQLGLFVFPGGAVFGERIFDLRNRRVIRNRLLQCFLFVAGWRPKGTPSSWTSWTTRTTFWSARSTRSTWPAHAHAASHVGLPARFHHFLNQRLNRGPFSVVGEVEVFSDVVHHALSELGRVEVASRPVVAGPARAAIARTTRTAAVVILGEQTSAGQAQGGDHPKNC
jgi:hypothetical protein